MPEVIRFPVAISEPFKLEGEAAILADGIVRLSLRCTELFNDIINAEPVLGSNNSELQPIKARVYELQKESFERLATLESAHTAAQHIAPEIIKETEIGAKVILNVHDKQTKMRTQFFAERREAFLIARGLRIKAA